MEIKQFKIWTREDVECYLDELSKKTGLDWRCMKLDVSKDSVRRLGVFEFIYASKKDGTPAGPNAISPKKIIISKLVLTGDVPENIVKEIIAHEFIHFYTNITENKKCSHDYSFKSNCKKFGFSDSVGMSSINIDEYLKENGYKYTVLCDNCGVLGYKSRVKSIAYFETHFACKSCKGHLTLIQNR